MAQATFEESLQKLEQIVTRLEKGDVPLEEALEAFQKGMALSKQCQETLTNAEETLTKMMQDNDQEADFEERDA